MITITLRKIKEENPCLDGWKKILTARGGDDADFDEDFPLADAFDSNKLSDVLWALRCLPEHNDLWRLYSVWCARQVQYLMKDPRSLKALDVAERYAKGKATEIELKAAEKAARTASYDANGYAAASCAAKAAAWAAVGGLPADTFWYASGSLAWEATWEAAEEADKDLAGAAIRDAQKEKLIEILNAGEWVD